MSRPARTIQVPGELPTPTEQPVTDLPQTEAAAEAPTERPVAVAAQAVNPATLQRPVLTPEGWVCPSK